MEKWPNYKHNGKQNGKKETEGFLRIPKAEK